MTQACKRSRSAWEWERVNCGGYLIGTWERRQLLLRKRGACLSEHGEVAIRLSYRPPYDWPAMLSFLRARAIRGIEVVSGNSYARTIEIGGLHGTVSVRPADGDALRAAVRFSRLSALPTIIARLRRVFDLAADPDAIGAHL